MLHTFKAAQEVGNYEDVPVLPADVDPQLYMSRNAVAQPFYLICGKDTVVVQMSGTADMHLKESSVRRFHMAVGDHVYVPAGTPTASCRPRKACSCDIERGLLGWRALPGTAPDATASCTAASGTPLKQSLSKSISMHVSPSTTTSRYVTAPTAAPNTHASTSNLSAAGCRSRSTCATSCSPRDQRAVLKPVLIQCGPVS